MSAYITGGYCLNPMGSCPKGTDWPSYWKGLKVYSQWDCFTRSSADMDQHAPWDNFDPVAGDIEPLRIAVKTQQVFPVSMGVYQYSSYVRDRTTDSLYLVVPQTGCAVFFKLHPC